MKTLMVSDRLSLDYPPHDMEIVPWDHRPSVEGFPLVVLDLYFGDPTDEGFVKTPDEYHRFYEMGAEVARCLKADGVVIACLGPVTNTPRPIGGVGFRDLTRRLKLERTQSEDLPDPSKESSYDWLDQGALSDLKLGHKNVKPSAGINWNVPGDRFYYLRKSVVNYYETFSGIDEYSGRRHVFMHRLLEKGRWDWDQNLIQADSRILATADHTNLPVAMSFDYNYFGGQLVLMPPLEAPEDEAVARELTADLKEFGEWIYSVNNLQLEERPTWVDDYLAPPALVIQQEISNLNQRIAELSDKKETYYPMLPLLYSTDTELEDAVELFFTEGDEGITVKKGDPGAHIDFFVQDSSGRSLAMEVTGIKGPLRHNNNHWSDFLNYLPEHNSRNETTRVERIVFVVNTYRDIRFVDRDRNGDVTPPSLKTATDNHMCIVRSGDLYLWWLQTLDGKSKQEVFDALFATEGIYEPPGTAT